MSRDEVRDKKKRWSTWINAELLGRGWNAADLVEASGGALVYNTVYNWTKGTANISSEFVVAVAETLGVDLVEVLRAGGYDVLADAFAGQALRVAGTAPASEPEPVDEVISLIMARRDLTEDERAKEVVRYRRRLADLKADTVDIINTVIEARKNGRGQPRSA